MIIYIKKRWQLNFFILNFCKITFGAGHFAVEACKRRAAIAGDEAAGVQPGRLVAQPLHQRDRGWGGGREGRVAQGRAVG